MYIKTNSQDPWRRSNCDDQNLSESCCCDCLDVLRLRQGRRVHAARHWRRWGQQEAQLFKFWSQQFFFYFFSKACGYEEMVPSEAHLLKFDWAMTAQEGTCTLYESRSCYKLHCCSMIKVLGNIQVFWCFEVYQHTWKVGIGEISFYFSFTFLLMWPAKETLFLFLFFLLWYCFCVCSLERVLWLFHFYLT